MQGSEEITCPICTLRFEPEGLKRPLVMPCCKKAICASCVGKLNEAQLWKNTGKIKAKIAGTNEPLPQPEIGCPFCNVEIMQLPTELEDDVEKIEFVNAVLATEEPAP